jgi:glutamate formiminotransferase/formiminotetrahydrofolate cyclodeaminase
VKAAFEAVKKAMERIDTRKHQGIHPRFGATDVCPLVPVKGVSMEEAINLSYQLGKRIGDELQIPVFYYERSATRPERKHLSYLRAGGVEALTTKLKSPAWAPDAGPAMPHPTAGAIAVGARKFLVAYNVSLGTTSVKTAKTIAENIRESGKIITNKKGEKERLPGRFSFVKAMGWYVKEFGKAQVSMNLTDLDVTPLHEVFEEIKTQAQALGTRVTGSELVGMIPEGYLSRCGEHAVQKYQPGLALKKLEKDHLIRAAIEFLGLNDARDFDPGKKIIERVLPY